LLDLYQTRRVEGVLWFLLHALQIGIAQDQPLGEFLLAAKIGCLKLVCVEGLSGIALGEQL
jgi:hypothetical protein